MENVFRVVSFLRTRRSTWGSCRDVAAIFFIDDHSPEKHATTPNVRSMGVWHVNTTAEQQRHVNITAWYNIIAVRMIECLTHVTKPTLILATESVAISCYLGNWDHISSSNVQSVTHRIWVKKHTPQNDHLMSPARFFFHPKSKHPMITVVIFFKPYCLRRFPAVLFQGKAGAGDGTPAQGFPWSCLFWRADFSAVSAWSYKDLRFKMQTCR